MAFVLVAKGTAAPGNEDRVRDCLERLAEHSRREPGCRFYQPCRSPEDPRAFLIFEIYDDEQAFEAHGAAAHFQEIVLGEAAPLLESRERLVYETL
jgi:quinol monooxygenase YgiN